MEIPPLSNFNTVNSIQTKGGAGSGSRGHSSGRKPMTRRGLALSTLALGPVGTSAYLVTHSSGNGLTRRGAGLASAAGPLGTYAYARFAGRGKKTNSAPIKSKLLKY